MSPKIWKYKWVRGNTIKSRIYKIKKFLGRKLFLEILISQFTVCIIDSISSSYQASNRQG